ncbi:L-lactate dehydrogenase-like protein [Lasiosphaeria hispida]|uniref:L-lactate dehydrogenase n=1 Tax=Lasiosphaeria hispida TaxID=260671 RepID=A0AAJ0HTL9_9PEZI|nr:L-lactate dehydrogenase-like protein [Lasiosphaeria hispida]
MSHEPSPANGKSIKIVIVGAGSVGVTTAYALLLSGLASELVLIDIDENRARGEATDLSHAAHFAHARVRVASDYSACEGATAVIITAGVNQKPGQTRMDLVKTNYGLFEAVVPQIAKHAPDTILIVATNPVDVLTHAAYELSGFPKERVIGSGTAMDTTRFRHELGLYYGVNPRNVHAVIIGEHGDSQLPVWSLASIAGMRLRDYCVQAGREYDEKAMDDVAQRTRGAAYEIIQRKGKTNYGVASVLVSILEPIVKDSDAIVTVSRVGTYEGVGPVALSMPCKLNREGAHQDVPLLLNEVEKEGVKASALGIREVILSVKKSDAES